jgi:antirestriction protein ArdC
MNGYETITKSIIEQLEKGAAPWNKPWSSKMPTNLKSQKEYRGINVILLASQGYASPYWLTYNQAASIGGNVRKGEHGSHIAFWKIGEYSKENRETHELENKTSVLLRTYTVFNLTQCEGIEGFDSNKPDNPIAECDALVSAMPMAPKIESSDKAWYRPAADTVGIPPRTTFSNSEYYYSTLFHELTHSTGHSSRIGREGIETLNKFGSELYSREELIAELGAAMLCGVTGIDKATIDNSAAYLQSWINVLKGDSRMIVQAASAAQKAADYIRGIKPIEVSDAK